MQFLEGAMSTYRASNAEDRLHEIHSRVNQSGRISVDELTQQLGLPKETITADLQTLAERRKIVLTYNGAASLTVGMYDLSLALRAQRQSEEKEQIGLFCAGLIENNDTIFLDSSSTAIAIAPYLKNLANLTVISNCLRSIHQLPNKPKWRILMPGGLYQRETDSLVGLKDLEDLTKAQIDKGFFGAHGVSVTQGITDVSEEEARVKQLFVGLSRQVIVAIDSTKWNQIGRYPFAQLEQVSLIVTDLDAPKEVLDPVRAKGVEIQQV